jgi:hypothetical protein
MSARRRALLAVLAVALLPAISASGARTYKTKVIVSLKSPAFHGRLQSGYGACIADRKVKLFRERPGPDRLMGIDARSGFYHGTWSIPLGRRAASGTYYARAMVQGDCLPGKSKRIRIDR